MMEEMQAGDIVKRALIAEGASLLAVTLILVALGPGRLYGAALWNAAKMRFSARGSRIDAEVRTFAGEVSRWDHEQAAGKNSRAGRERGCGCGG